MQDDHHGAVARLSSVLWLLSPVCGVEVQNLADLYAGGLCETCLLPRGARTDRTMVVRHTDGAARRCDGVLAQLRERPRGPTCSLFSDRFLALLSDAERGHLHWRPVEVMNPTKTTRPLFELVASAAHVPFVALRGGRPDRHECADCGYRGPPYYPLVGSLPTWLKPGGGRASGDQPGHYVNAHLLPDPPWPLFSAGDWRGGPWLVASAQRPWPDRRSPGVKGINRWPVGAVAPWLIDAEG